MLKPLIKQATVGVINSMNLSDPEYKPTTVGEFFGGEPLQENVNFKLNDQEILAGSVVIGGILARIGSMPFQSESFIGMTGRAVGLGGVAIGGLLYLQEKFTSR